MLDSKLSIWGFIVLAANLASCAPPQPQYAGRYLEKRQGVNSLSGYYQGPYSLDQQQLVDLTYTAALDMNEWIGNNPGVLQGAFPQALCTWVDGNRNVLFASSMGDKPGLHGEDNIISSNIAYTGQEIAGGKVLTFA